MGGSKSLYLRRKLNKREIFSRIYFERNHDINKTILIEGFGRSGTTWLGDMLSEILKYRIIFEPFNPRKVSILSGLVYKEYISPDCINETYYNIFEKILSGQIKGRWINKDNRIFRPQGRIIKSIRASFFLKWLKNNFPMLPIVFILRHPCAVVLSRVKLGWSEDDLDLLLKQDMLIKNHLKPYLDIINKAKTLIQKNACLWCIQNLIPFKEMRQSDWIITTYEHLVNNTNEEMKKILNYINYKGDYNILKLKNKISSEASGNSAIVKGTDLLKSWQKRLSSDEINEILEIVRSFSMDWLYGSDIMPKKKFN